MVNPWMQASPQTLYAVFTPCGSGVINKQATVSFGSWTIKFGFQQSRRKEGKHACVSIFLSLHLSASSSFPLCLHVPLYRGSVSTSSTSSTSQSPPLLFHFFLFLNFLLCPSSSLCLPFPLYVSLPSPPFPLLLSLLIYSPLWFASLSLSTSVCLSVSTFVEACPFLNGPGEHARIDWSARFIFVRACSVPLSQRPRETR